MASSGKRSTRVTIVPCTQEKVWDAEPSRGAVAARDAYTGRAFARWIRTAEETGDPWYVLSTKHGLLEPDGMVEPYNVGITNALRNDGFLVRLREQGAQVGVSAFERVELLDWELFEPLVWATIGPRATNAEVGIRRVACPALQRLECPGAKAWSRAYQGLLAHFRDHGEEGEPPPIPLILAAWPVSSDEEKHHRWRALVNWAYARGLWDRVWVAPSEMILLR